MIKNLFDKNRDLYRTIEKVISYSAAKENLLKGEIAEYIVTDSIEEQLEELLGKMQLAMDSHEPNEVGVWVSGFYGSGKSSFTKYLGMALDQSVQIEGTPFLKHLQDRLHKPQARALLGTVAQRYPAAVIMLDLASEMVAGATMEDVSTVLYYKVLQWAGYSRNLKVAALERKLQKDGRYDEFRKLVKDSTCVEWKTIQNSPLEIDSLVPEIAHQLYPQLFRTPTSFNTETAEIIRFENERVKEMLDIVREHSGRDYVVFVVDEVGQYVGSRQNLILNLDGLAKNLKAIGKGKVWILSTAQQTLTEDDPRAALNSPELFKLKDRFPIQIDLESKDIKEICYKRLLGKSTTGKKKLLDMFEKHGQALRHATSLQDAKYYDSDFDKEAFANLYPFLPAHFDILLHLLGSLAKSTGGIGLRSAIKIVQDILIDQSEGRTPIADMPVGTLATTVTLYDSLELNIKGAFPAIHRAANKVEIIFKDSSLHIGVAKTVAVLQILSNLPITAHNVAALMHASVDGASQKEAITKAIEELINEPLVPFGEQDGWLRFYSERLNDIQKERAEIPVRSSETRRILNESLREALSPLPSVRLHNALTVATGLKSRSGSFVSSLAGDREAIQTVIELVEPAQYDETRTQLVDESRQRTAQNQILVCARTSPEMDDLIADIYRCREMAQRYRNEADQEIKEFCNAQADRAVRLATQLEHMLKKNLAGGSFIFRGQTTAVDGSNLNESFKKQLSNVADQVFDRFAEAPVRADTSTAEKFLKTTNLGSITSAIDPLGLVQKQGGSFTIKTDHKALVSIRDYIDRTGIAEGRRLTDFFSNPPFGWSPDTIRYLVAAMLVAGEIELRISGREITSSGEQAIGGLKTNNAFKPVGIALREERPSQEMCAKAAQRLTELIGDTVVPLEQEIMNAAAKQLPQIQLRLSPLAGVLENLSLPGVQRIRDLSNEIADMIATDASDAPQRLGSEESAVYDSLKWAMEVDRALNNGLADTIKEIRGLQSRIEGLPSSGTPGALKYKAGEDIAAAAEKLSSADFYINMPELNTLLTGINGMVRDAAKEMLASQQQAVRNAEEQLQRVYGWGELTQEEQSGLLARLEDIPLEASEDLAGIEKLVQYQFDMSSLTKELTDAVLRVGKDKRAARIAAVKEQAEKEGKKAFVKNVKAKTKLTKVEDLDALISQLQELRRELEGYQDIELTFDIE